MSKNKNKKKKQIISSVVEVKEKIVVDGKTENNSDEMTKAPEKDAEKNSKASSGRRTPLQAIGNFFKYSIHTWIGGCFFLALGMELILEMLGRRSCFLGFQFMLSSPIVFVYNASIIFFTLLFALFLRKRVFGLLLIGTIWIACGIVNFVVLGYRITPFAAIDFLMVKDVVSMLDVYLAKWQQILLVVAVVGLIVGLVFLFRKTPKFEGKRHVVRIMVLCIGIWTSLILFTNFSVKHNIISDDFANLGMAYSDYGFAYCFTNSIIDNGISKPEFYSREAVDSVRIELDKEVPNANKRYKKTPNIICVQLESFFDPNVVEGLELSENPIPTFDLLKEKFPSGYLTVPALGAGTANSEFEVLTGIRSAYFGAGEYPYKTTVNSKPVEGMCSLLEDQGYNTFAIHNNKSSFYDRKNVYDKMGFQHFISLEYMYNVKKTSTGWAKDYGLINDIESCLRSTVQQDFIFTISVQGHGKYPEELGMCDEEIKVSYPQDPVKEIQLTYYINQLHEMDVFIHDLIFMLDSLGEDYVLLLYGDHLPTITFEDEQLPHTQFQTEYILVNNMKLDLEDEDIATYEVSTKIFSALNLDKGYVQKARLFYDDSQVDEKITLLAYDMLYGDCYLYESGSPVSIIGEPEIIMGIRKIGIINAKNESMHFVVKGSNFNEFSKVYVGDEEKTTVYVDRSTLMVTDALLNQGDVLTVKQVDESGHVLSSTDSYNFCK